MAHDFINNNSKLMKEWDWEKNNALNIFPDRLTCGSHKKVWWICKNNHSYLMTISDKRVQGCPYCSNKKILVGYNDLTTTHPHLITEWNYNKNTEILPNQITYGTTKKVWWICNKCKFEWEASPNNRSKGTGCPVCANRIILSGINDLATLFPNVAKKWHPSLNILKPNQVAPKSHQKAYFICNNDSNHYFQTRIDHMVNTDIKCPICANQKILKGFNDLKTTHPKLVEEWDYEKNTNIFPENITYGTTRKVWWKCKKGHCWKASVSSRAGSQKAGCPICKKELFISFPEKCLSYYLSKHFIIEENKKFNWLGHSELDIFIPQINLAIEYDGQAWHKNINKDIKKDLLCEENKIKLIRIRELNCPKYESSSIKFYIKAQNNKELNNIIISVFNYINNNYNIQLQTKINIQDDYYDILSRISTMVKDKSVYNSELIKEWNYDKNNKLLPETLTIGSNKKVWWICKNGHEWQASISSRSGKQKCGCPYCAGQKVYTGWNDLQTLFPNISKEWDYEKNQKHPNQIRPQSNKKYWWKCLKCGFSWETAVSHRIRGRNCPKCSRQNTIISHYKQVLCLETQEIFSSIKSASKKYNINRTSISNCCKGKSKTAGKMHWKYIEKD